MFNNIGNKIKMLAKVLCIAGIVVSVIWGFVLFDESFLAGAVAIVIGGLGAWTGSFGLYGFGELIEETTRNRAINEQLLNMLVKQNAPEPPPIGAECADAIGTHSIEGAKKVAWQCSKCQGYNASTAVSCKFCGKDKQ